MKPLLKKILNNLKDHLLVKKTNFLYEFNECKANWLLRWQHQSFIQRTRLIIETSFSAAISLFLMWFIVWLWFGPYFASIDGAYVRLDRGLSLAGSDTDKNGIRDDMDEYIAALAKKKGYDKKEVNALKQAARAAQGLVMMDLKSRESIDKADDADSRASTCAFKVFRAEDAIKIRRQISNNTFNTWRRSDMLSAYGHVMNGSVISLPEENVCD